MREEAVRAVIHTHRQPKKKGQALVNPRLPRPLLGRNCFPDDVSGDGRDRGLCLNEPARCHAKAKHRLTEFSQ
jgi:hypothetical protein